MMGTNKAGVLFSCCSLLLVSDAGAIGYVYIGVGDDGREWLELTSVTVDIEIEGRVAVTRTDQVFTNHAGRVLEGIYEFVLPDGAIITDLVLWIDGKRIPGLILEKQLARNAYDAIVSGRADPALIEQVTPNLFRLSIFPFPARGSRRVELEYMQVLESRQGVIRYSFPLSPEGDEPVLLERLIVRGEVRSRHPIQVAASETGSQITEMERPDEFTARAFYGDERISPQRDYELTITETAKPLLPTVLSLAPRGEEYGYFALWLPPVTELAEADPVPRNLTFLIDVSRSMGEGGTAAIEAGLAAALASLGEGDFFNLITFGKTPVSFAESPVEATLENKEAAIRFAASWEATGLSNLESALQQALQQPFPGESPNHVVVFTDGRPTHGETSLESLGRMVEESAPGGVRLFAVGVGSETDRGYLRALTRDHGGAVYFWSEPEIEAGMSAFIEELAYPVFQPEDLVFSGVEVRDLLPREFKPVAAGQELFFVGRYRIGGAFTAGLTGQIQDRSFSFEYPLELARADDSQEIEVRQGEILLYEDFDDGIADGWQNAPGTQGVWSVDGDKGVYQVREVKHPGVSRSFYAVNDSSYSIETRLRFRGAEGKVIFSEADRHEAWRLDLITERNTARLSVAGIFIWGIPFQIERNVWYVVRLDIGEGLIDAYVNGNPVYEDAWLGGITPDGVIGVGSYFADAEFDYVRVRRGIGVKTASERLTSIARLWAYHLVQALEDQISRFGPLDELLEDILRLGLDYRLVTRATSLFAPEEGIQVNPRPGSRREGGEVRGEGDEDEDWSSTTAVEDSLESASWLGRTFRLSEGIWVDMEFRHSMEVEAYDPAAGQPGELAAFAGLNRNIIVVIVGRAYRLRRIGPPAPVLLQNVPNPFNSTTRIRFLLPAGPDPGQLRVAVYDLLGRVVRVLKPAALPVGGGMATWDGRDSAGREVSSGVYIYRLEGLGTATGRRMMLLR